MSASREAILAVIQLLPFGGIGKIGFALLEKALKGV
jgi:hypothetical protein